MQNNSASGTNVKSATESLSLQQETSNMDEQWKVQMIVEMKSTLTESFKELSKNLMEDITALRVENKKVREDLESLESKQVETDAKVDENSGKMKVCQEQIRELQGIVIRQDQIIQECKSKIEDLQAHNGQNIIKIRGLKEEEGENCREVVKSFFKNKMKITTTVGMNKLYRIGKGKHRTMLIYVKTLQDKKTVFSHVKSLKGVKNEVNKSYQIGERLPARKQESKRKTRDIWVRNKKKESVADKLKMTIEKSKLLIDGEEYVEPRITKDTNWIGVKQEEVDTWKVDVKKGREIIKEN